MSRIGLAFRCFFSVLGGKALPEEALPPKEEVKALEAPKDDFAEAIQMLSILQKEGRLIDFLQEEIKEYDDEQIGAAVRTIHRDCRQALAEHLKLEKVIDGEEDSDVNVEKGFDPSVIRLSGNVTGEPPFTGVLRHHGWRVTDIELPKRSQNANTQIVAPAEVELK